MQIVRPVVLVAVPALLALLPEPARAQLAVTPYGLSNGFSLSTFATGFPTNPNPFGPFPIGPLGISIRPNGSVLVSTLNGELRSFPFDTPIPGPVQSAATLSPIASLGSGNACGMTYMATGLYLAQQTAGQVVRISESGAVLAAIAPVPHATAICGFPQFASAPGTLGYVGHMFVSSAGGPAATDVITEVDPSLPYGSAASVFLTASADGLCFTSSGAYLLAASGPGLRMWNMATKALAFEATVPGSDGIAIGTGALLGKVYLNCTNGTVVEVVYDQSPGVGPELDPPAGGSINTICTNGTRGDFIASDRLVASGTLYPSLLLTQSDEIVRLDPPGGGFFGPPDSIDGLIGDCDSNGFNDAAEIAASPFKDLDFDGRLDVCEGLSANKATLPLLAGGTQQLSIHPGTWFHNQPYLTLGSFSGTLPGTPVDGVLVPLNVDNYTLLTLTSPNSATLPGSLGLLNAAGLGAGGVAIPPGAPLVLLGLTLNHATVFLDVSVPMVSGATNSVRVAFTL
jgi:hypothetical protein